jgi:hypothetical protein
MCFYCFGKMKNDLWWQALPTRCVKAYSGNLPCVFVVYMQATKPDEQTASGATAAL